MQTISRSPPAERARFPSLRCTALDVFFAVNLALAFGVWFAANGALYLPLVVRSHATEFFLFAAVLLAGVGALWGFVRRYPMPVWILAVTEGALLMHFAGGLLHFGGLRLYGHVFLGIRFDKFVHIAAAFALGTIMMELATRWRLPAAWFTRSLVALAALGLAAGVEIYEYLITRTMPLLTTARFEDSLRDLVADLCGVVLWFIFAGALAHRFHPFGDDP